MDVSAEASRAERPGPSPWRALGLVTLLYAVTTVVATYPAITTVRTLLPDLFADPLVHLWTMRWHKQTARACDYAVRQLRSHEL